MTRLSGAIAFAVGGLALLIGTLAVEPWSLASAIGLAVGAGLLALGYWSGVPRIKELTRQQTAPTVRGGLAANVLAWSSAVGAVVASIGIAYAARKIGHALHLHLDLGVVGALIGSAATLYAALLQYVAARERTGSSGVRLIGRRRNP